MKAFVVIAVTFLASAKLLAYEPISGITQEVEKAIHDLVNAKICLDNVEIDHVTRVANDVEDYLNIKTQLEEEGDVCLFDSVFNKRAQAPYELNTPFMSAGKFIPIVENACPFGGSKPGLEQMKLIVPTTVADFVDQHPHIKFDLTQLFRPSHPEASLIINGVTFRFREVRLKQLLKGRKGATDHPASIAGGGILTYGILSAEQRQKLVNEKPGDRPFSELTLGSWTVTMKDIKEASPFRLNLDRTSTVFCLLGKMKVELADTAFTLNPGDSIQIPPGICYRFLPLEDIANRILLTDLL